MKANPLVWSTIFGRPWLGLDRAHMHEVVATRSKAFGYHSAQLNSKQPRTTLNLERNTAGYSSNSSSSKSHNRKLLLHE